RSGCTRWIRRARWKQWKTISPEHLATVRTKRRFHFALRHVKTNRFIGCTRYVSIVPLRRGLEIGFTWYAPQFWRTSVNTECKYLFARPHGQARRAAIRQRLEVCFSRSRYNEDYEPSFCQPGAVDRPAGRGAERSPGTAPFAGIRHPYGRRPASPSEPVQRESGGARIHLDHLPSLPADDSG